MQLTGKRSTRSARLLAGLTAGAAGVALVGALLPAQPAYALAGADFYATLDLSRPELAAVKAQVDQGDYAGADQAMLTFYAGRETPTYFPIEPNPDAVPRAMDIAAGHFEFPGGMVRDYYDSANNRIDVDWDDRWDEYVDPPVNAPSQMNRFTFYPDLAAAYVALPAGDPRRGQLAVAWMQLATDFIADKGEVPIGAAPHNRLTEGIRLRFWLDAFSVFRHSSAVSAGDLVSYLDYVRQSARDIQLNIERHKGNNWYISLARSIYLTSVYLPEFKDAPTWRFKGMSVADRYIDRNVRSDGISYEPAINYQHYALALIATMQEFGSLNGDQPFTDAELSFVLLQAEALAAAVMPNFTVPLFGDTQHAELDLGVIGTFADLFDRDDLTWVATRGASGQRPAWDSMLYPESYAVMRSGWDTGDQYLFVGNQDTNYNASHRHPDDLGVVAYAYGRPLVVDPGAYTYDEESASATWLRRTTEAHNTVEVGGVPQPKTTQAIPKARRSLQWYSNDGFDFYQGDHVDYLPIKHSRGVFSPKPGFWIVSDVLTGSPGQEDYRQLWHFPADAPVAIDAGTETVTAGFGEVPGIVVAPVDAGTTTTNRHSDGYVADGYGNLHSGVDYVSFAQSKSGNATFDTLLYPGDAGAAPDVTTTRISLPVSTSVATAMRLNLPGGAQGMYYLSHEKNPATRGMDGHQYDGRLCYVERDQAGEITSIALAAGKKLTSGATTLVSSTAPVNDLSVRYEGNRLVLSTGGPLAGNLSVHAPGVTGVVLNGSSVDFTRNGDRVRIAAPRLAPADTLLDEPFGAVRDGGHRTWRFVDNNTEHWQPVRGDWSVRRNAGGAWRYTQTARETVDGLTAVPASLDDVSVTTDVTRGATSANTYGFGVVLRYRDTNNHYKLRLYRSSGTVHAQILAKVGGTETVIASNAVAVNLADQHRLTGTIRGDRITFKVDGAVVVSGTDNRLTTGGIGLWAHRTRASFDDVDLDARRVWDFDDGRATGWRGLQGTWAVHRNAGAGVYQQTNPNQNTGMTVVEQDANDVSVSATVDLGQTGSSAHGYGIAVRMHDHRTYYLARIYRTSAGTFAQLYKNVGGTRTDFTSGSGVPLSLNPAEPHLLRVRASGDLLHFWIDGRLVASAVDEEIPTGGVGLQAHNASVSFDDVAVAELTGPRSWSASRGHFADNSESLRLESAGVSGSQLNLAETMSWEDSVTEATIRPSDWSAAGEVGLSVRSTGDSLGYRCVLVDTGSGQYARIERHAAGSRATSAPVVIAQQRTTFSNNGSLPIRVVARGSTIEFRLDGVLLTSATDTVIRRGGVSIIGSGVNASVTGVKVRALVER